MTETPPHDDAATAADGHAHTNRLARESSPYLLQHQHNPVDWYAWGDEAFEKARAEDKPIFLSIGYSTCHWCHVMERESFESEEIAAVLNEHFVSVKVDREERPDVDAVYMKAAQTMTGSGGWPLSVWLNHDLEPFFAGTYFPPEDRHGRPGFPTLLKRIDELWTTRRDELERQADALMDAVRKQNAAAGGADLGHGLISAAVRQFGNAFDSRNGGFGGAPKFPRAFSLSFLMRQASRGNADAILPLVKTTLDNMQLGGIHDHLGGGFHRYSTDAEWLVPHFEKMLYDQAILGRAYVEAWQIFRDPAYRDTARDTLDYVLRDLRDPAGGFHSAEDADSEGEEGKFYVFSEAEVVEILGAEDAALLSETYQFETRGNFIDEAKRVRTGSNIPHLDRPLADHARDRGEDPDEFATRMTTLREKLFAARALRIRPHLDDKVLTDWNGLAIGTFAYAGAAFGEERYLDAAREAADFALTELRTDDGLLHRYRDGDAGIPAFLDDYAYLAHGLLELHQATQEPRWLAASRDLLREMNERFRDPDRGVYELAARDAASLPSRTVELYDGALPSGNSVAMLTLLRVGRITGDAELEALGRATMEAWSGTMTRYPMGHPVALTALDFDLGPAQEIVLAVPGKDDADPFLAELHDRFLPRALVLVHTAGDTGSAVRSLAPFVVNQVPVDGAAAAYVCENHACQAPVTGPAEMVELLR